MTAIWLSKGAHETAEQGACAMEWVAWAAGEPHSDHPQCVSPVIGVFVRALNDKLPDAERQALVPVLLDCIGTHTTKDDEVTRAFLAIDWAARTVAPMALRACGLVVEAERLATLTPVTGMDSAKSARDVADRAVRAACDAAFSAPADALAPAAGAYAAVDASRSAVDLSGMGDLDVALVAAVDVVAYSASGAVMWAEVVPHALDVIRRMAAVGRTPVDLIPERVAALRAVAP